MFPLPLRLSNRRPLIPVTVHYVKGFIERSPLIHKQIHRKPSFHKLEIREEGEGKQISRASRWSIQESALDQERWENVQVSSHYQRYVIEISFLSFFFFFHFASKSMIHELSRSRISRCPLENRIDPWVESVPRGRIYKTNGEFLRENSSHGRSSRKAKSRCCNSASDKGPFPSFMGRKEGRGGLISDRSLKETRMELLKLPESS